MRGYAVEDTTVRLTAGNPTVHPVAVAIGNASLLSVGYLLLGRRRIAAFTLLGTVVLLVVLSTALRTLWFEIVVLVWWVALIVHGFLLARRDAKPGGRLQWPVAIVPAVVVLLAFGLLRADAAGIDRSVTDARAAGDCTQGRAAVDRVSWVHRPADAPVTVRTDETRDVCDRLSTVDDRFAVAAGGDVAALSEGFDGLSGILRERPGHEEMVDRSVDRFLGTVSALRACNGAVVTDWLTARPSSGDTLDRSLPVARTTAPPRIVECGDVQLSRGEWAPAQARYQQLLDQYPRSPLAARAQAGVVRAVQGAQLENVRGLLAASYGSPPQYCSQPAPYSGARPYAPGLNTALIFADPAIADPLPPEWKARDAADAVLVVCIGEREFGGAVRTCPYTSERNPGGGPQDVTFFRVAVPVKAYELRTGRVVLDARVEINGASCPPTIDFETLFPGFGGPPDQYVAPSPADIRAAFAGLVTP